MPPIYERHLRRNTSSRHDAINIYYLTDGVVSEVKFFDALFNYTDFINNKDYRFIRCEKTGTDSGISNGLGLVKLARKYIKTNPKFKEGKDKVLIVFDLDVYSSDLSMVIESIEKERDILFAY